MAGGEQRGGLLLPCVAIKRPAMDEHDRRTGAVIFVIELGGLGIFLSDFDGAHESCPLSRLNEIVGSNDAVIPAAARASVSRRRCRFRVPVIGRSRWP